MTDPRYRVWDVQYCKKGRINYEALWKDVVEPEEHAQYTFVNLYSLPCSHKEVFARDCKNVDCLKLALQAKTTEQARIDSYSKIRDVCGNCNKEVCICSRCTLCGLHEAACDCAAPILTAKSNQMPRIETGLSESDRYEEAKAKVTRFLDELKGQYLAFHPEKVPREVCIQDMLKWRWRTEEHKIFLQWHDSKFPQWKLLHRYSDEHNYMYCRRSRKAAKND